MNFLRPHRFWLCLLTLALCLIFGSGPALDLARGKTAQNLAEIKAAQAKTQQALLQLRDDVTAARKLSGQIDSVRAEEVLAPTDRLKAAAMLEKESAEAGLSHFTYTLAPEEHVPVNAGGEPQELASSAITLAGDARDDIRIYDFIERIRHLLPGRVRLQQMTVMRIGAANAALSPTANVHFEATLEWLSNGAVQTAAGAP